VKLILLKLHNLSS
jgi:Ca2+-binding EF-hand superfamily protein/ankyrin repeat protein